MGDHQDFIYVRNLLQTPEGLLDKRLARSKNIVELLRKLAGADGPKSAADATGHYHTESVVHPDDLRTAKVGNHDTFWKENDSDSFVNSRFSQKFNARNFYAMLNIVLFGPPGAGKGTQSELIEEKYHLTHLSTGELLRSEIRGGSNLGKEAARLMDAGQLVPDKVVVEMMDHRLRNGQATEGFVFDGFPRTAQQAKSLDKLLEKSDESIVAMIALQVPEKELVERLLSRGKNGGRSDDKNEATIKNRLQVYREETEVVRDYYQKQNKFVEVKGTGSIEEVFGRICTAIENAR